MRYSQTRARLVVEGDARVEFDRCKARERGFIARIRVPLALRTPPVRKSTSESGAFLECPSPRQFDLCSALHKGRFFPRTWPPKPFCSPAKNRYTSGRPASAASSIAVKGVLAFFVVSTRNSR